MPGLWHNKMESYFPKDMTEIKFLCSSKNSNDTCRRADILLNNKRTCEIQHSFISSEEISKRFNDWNMFGKEIIWLVDGNTGVECEQLSSGNYLIIINDEWKYKSFIKNYDYILLEIDTKVFKIELKKIKCKMIELKMFISIDKVVEILKSNPEYIWDEWKDDNVVKCTLSIHQAGAGNGKTYGIWKSIAENMNKEIYIILTKQHSAKNVIYEELIDQTNRQEFHIENLTEKTEENTPKHFVIKYIHKKSKRECSVIIGTIDSFCYNLSGSSKTCDNFFEGILNNIKNNGITKVSFNGNMIFGGQTFPLNKKAVIWIDEVQDLPNTYLHAMAKLMLETNCDIEVVGDKLQSLEFEDNFLTSIIAENGLIENIHLNIHNPRNINIRIKVNGMREEINKLIDFHKYGLPKIDCRENDNNDLEEITEPTIEIIESKKMYANDNNIEKVNNYTDQILEIVDYEVKNNNYTPENFMFIFPIMKNNNIASELQTKLTNYWIDKFSDTDYRESLGDNNYWKNYQHDEYTQYVYLHKHTEGTCINTKDSVNASRIMSIRTSKGDGREVVFILGVTEKTLKMVSNNKIGLVYESHLHVALTRAKCKNYVSLEPNGDKIHKLFSHCGYIGCFPIIKNRIQLDKIFDNLDKIKMIELMENNNIKQDEFLSDITLKNDLKESVDWGYHCIKYSIYYFRSILYIVNKRYENTDFNDSELCVVLNKLSRIKIQVMCPLEFYNYLNTYNSISIGKNCDLPEFPLCNLSDKQNYSGYFIKIKDAMKKIQVCIINDELVLLDVYESVVLVYMIKLFKEKKYIDISPVDLYNITDFFKKKSKEYNLLNMVENVDNIINTVLDNVDVKTKWNISKHITLKGLNDEFTLCNQNFPIIGYNNKEITHIILKSEINSLNFWDIMINSLLERFLIYNPQHDGDVKKYENKQINTYIFILNSNKFIKIDWSWDKDLSVEIKKEIKKAMLLYFSDNHEEIYNYFCYIKNNGDFFGKDKEIKTPFQYIFTQMKTYNKYPGYIIKVFEELHEKLVRGNKEEVKNICENVDSFSKKLYEKLEIECDNYLGISEMNDYDF